VPIAHGTAISMDEERATKEDQSMKIRQSKVCSTPALNRLVEKEAPVPAEAGVTE
jgi:hypothetical protein